MNALEARAWLALQQVTDPEIPVVSIAELGILRSVHALGDGSVQVNITPTYSGCPAMGQIADDVRTALQAAGLQGSVNTLLAPAWTTDWMSASAHEKLRAYGIAPPHSVAPGAAQVIRFATKKVADNAYSVSHSGGFHAAGVACPQCQSRNTTETSHFGSTACKALYKCLDCLEPFDYFKPY